MNLLLIHDFVSCIGYLQNIGSLSYADPPHLHISLYNSFKDEVFKYWDTVKFMGGDRFSKIFQNFPKFLFESQLFSLKLQARLIYF